MHVWCRQHRRLGHCVDAINLFTAPKDKKGLQEFWGMLAFHHRFVVHAVHLLHPLHDAWKEEGKSLTWTNAFRADKTTLAAATLLVHPKNAATSITVDASSTAICASLEHYTGIGSHSPSSQGHSSPPRRDMAPSAANCWLPTSQCVIFVTSWKDVFFTFTRITSR